MNLIDFKPWEVHRFPWGSAVKKRGCAWSTVFIGEQELNVEALSVELDSGGIRFKNEGETE